jgi:hypothetical protein
MAALSVENFGFGEAQEQSFARTFVGHLAAQRAVAGYAAGHGDAGRPQTPRGPEGL